MDFVQIKINFDDFFSLIIKYYYILLALNMSSMLKLVYELFKI